MSRFVNRMIRNVDLSEVASEAEALGASSEHVSEILERITDPRVLRQHKSIWVAEFAKSSKARKNRVALASALGDPVARQVVPSRRRADFPSEEFFYRNKKILTPLEWLNFMLDCAENVLDIFEDYYPNDKRPRFAIETTRRFVESVEEGRKVSGREWDSAYSGAYDAQQRALGDAIADETSTPAAAEVAYAALQSIAALKSSHPILNVYVVASSARMARTQVVLGGRELEEDWQRNCLIDYLIGFR